MEFDNKIADLEKAIKSRKKDLKELESMYCDAQIARDNAKVTQITIIIRAIHVYVIFSTHGGS